MTSRDEILTALHQTAVELCLMKGINKPLEKLCEILEHEERVLALLNRVQVKAGSEPGIDALIFPNENVKEALLEFFREFDAEQIYENAESATESEPVEAVATSPRSSKLDELDIEDLGTRTPESSEFLSLSLGDRTFQFAVSIVTLTINGEQVSNKSLSFLSAPVNSPDTASLTQKFPL